ncbi:NB-ARC domain-containing protein [Actinomadura nitritigenes]|uniref:NB-ARC domain-containing protein n=1 Tax=Actinomadura nitritigenes TaxID=134602 RepID=UPI003D89ED1D
MRVRDRRLVALIGIVAAVVTLLAGVPVNKLSDLVFVGRDKDLRFWLAATGACVVALVALGLAAEFVAGRAERRNTAPFDVPAQDAGWVPRRELALAVAELLRVGRGTTVAFTTGLQGAGGFGKTMLAREVARHPDVRRRYKGGVVWTTIGRDRRGADLAELIGTLTARLGGVPVPTSDPEQAGLQLGQVLAGRRPTLLVIDDVWDEGQLTPFLGGSGPCTRLVTTRNAKALPRGAARIQVDQMDPEAAERLLTQELPSLDPSSHQELLTLTGGWPLLLSLVNGVLRDRIEAGRPATATAREVAARLRAAGPTALDVDDRGSRQRAVRATVEYSLETLGATFRARYLELGVFAEDTLVPLDVVTALWGATAGLDPQECDALAARFAENSLVRMHGGELELHDVLRDYARSQLEDAASVHRALVERLRTGEWWDLGPGYLLRYLAHHLSAAGLAGELDELVIDVRWLDTKIKALGPAAAISDLRFAAAPEAGLVHAALVQSAHLLEPAVPASVLSSTLLSRLRMLVPELSGRIDGHLARGTSLLEARWPLPDLPDPRLVRQFTWHTGRVTGLTFAPDGSWLASVDELGGLRLWTPSGADLGTAQLDVPGPRPADVRIGPDGSWLIVATEDGEAHLYAADGEHLADLGAAHPGGLAAWSAARDGAWLATLGRTGTVRCWTSRGTRLAGPGRPRAGTMGLAVAPDGSWLAAVDAAGTVRRWDREGDGWRSTVLLKGGGRGFDSGLVAYRALITGRAAFRRHAGTPDTAAVRRITSLLRGLAAGLRVKLGLLSGAGPLGWFAAATGFRVSSHLTRAFDSGWRIGRQSRDALRATPLDRPAALAISPDGTWLAACTNDGRVQLLSADGTPLRSPDFYVRPGARVWIAPDGEFLVICAASTLRLWSREPQPDQDAAPLSSETVHGITPYAAPRAVTGRPDLFLVETRRGPRVFTGRGEEVDLAEEIIGLAYARSGGLCALGPDPATAAVAFGGSIHLYHSGVERVLTEPWTRGVTEAVLTPSGDSVIERAFRPAEPRRAGGRGSGDHRRSEARCELAVRATDGTFFTVLSAAPHLRGDDGFLVFAGGRRIVTVHDDLLQLWDARGKRLALLPGETHPAADPSESGFVTVSTRGRTGAAVWTDDGEPVLRFGLPGGFVQVRRRGDRIVTLTAERELRLWTPDGVCRATRQDVDDFAFFPDAGLLTWGPSGITVHGGGSAHELAFSCSSPPVLAPTWFALSEDGLVELWNRDGTRRSAATGRDPVVSPCGTWFTTAESRSAITVWSDRGAVLRKIEGPPGWAAGPPVISPSGGRLLAVSDDGTLRVADTATGEIITGIRTEAPSYTSLTWFPDSTGFLAIGAQRLYSFTMRRP